MSDNANKWGLAALGRHGSIQIDLDEPITGDRPWRLQIGGRILWRCALWRRHQGDIERMEKDVGLQLSK
jgi:hypothetical protein